jgi:hypothetical protein
MTDVFPATGAMADADVSAAPAIAAVCTILARHAAVGRPSTCFGQLWLIGDSHRLSTPRIAIFALLISAGKATATTDRSTRDILPGRGVERRGALRPANSIAPGLGREEELPHNLAGLGVERVHVPFGAFESPPALPMKTRPSQAIGAAGTLSPFFTSAIVVSHSRLPVLKS